MSAALRLAVVDDELMVSHPVDGAGVALMQASGAVVDIARALGVAFDGRSVDDVGAACVEAIAHMQAANRELLKTQLVFQTLMQWGL